jgi:hypothetical protein
VNINDPIIAETATRIIRGRRKLFLVCLTGLFSDYIASQAFAGFIIISFIL